MNTPTRTMRIPEPLEAAARAGTPELAGLGIGELVRAALAMLAGAASPAEAAAAARMSKAPYQPHRGPRKKSVPESPEVRTAGEDRAA